MDASLLRRNVNIPVSLREIPRWCRWRWATSPSGKLTKQPVGSTLDPATRRSFAEVEDDAQIGFVFTGGVVLPDRSRLIALDLDGCRDPETGHVSRWVAEVLEMYDSFTEITPSQNGLRLWVAVEAPVTFARFTAKVEADAVGERAASIQVFGATDVAGYVTVTGDVVPGGATDIRRVRDLSWLGARFGLGRAADDEPGPDTALPTGPDVPLDILGTALVAVGGDKARRLIAGDWEGYESASEGFAALQALALRVARGNGRRVVEYLLTRTAWGRGEVEGSADPTRYMRESWVSRDVARTSRKLPLPPPPEVVFEELPAPPAPTTAPPRASRLMHGSELVRRRSDEPFLVYGVLPRSGIAQFFGEPSCGKTPFVLSLALHVAGGLPLWFGHELDRHGAVVYFVGEDESGLAARYTAECQRLGLDASRLPLWFSRQPGSLTDVADVAAWIADIRATTPDVALVVIDTQAQNFGPADENDTADMNAFVRSIHALAQALGCLVTTLHHTGHSAKDRGRGSSVMFGALDACFEVTRTEMAVQAFPTKHKNWAAPAPLLGSLEVVTLGTDRKGRPITAVTLRDEPPAPAEVFEAVDESEQDTLARFLRLVDSLKGKPITVYEIARRLRLPTGGRKLRALVERAETDLLLVDSSVISGDKKRGKQYRLTQKGVTAISAQPHGAGSVGGSAGKTLPEDLQRAADLPEAARTDELWR